MNFEFYQERASMDWIAWHQVATHFEFGLQTAQPYFGQFNLPDAAIVSIQKWISGAYSKQTWEKSRASQLLWRKFSIFRAKMMSYWGKNNLKALNKELFRFESLKKTNCPLMELVFLRATQPKAESIEKTEENDSEIKTLKKLNSELYRQLAVKVLEWTLNHSPQLN